MKRRYQLRLIGITYNQIESGVYAVILEEMEGLKRRIPIIIGYPEAQAIECKLQEVVTPRPLTHDLIKNLMDTFDLRLACVEIHKHPNGVFAADLIMEGPDGDLRRIDARSSDAIAIAIRTGSPIYTSADVLEESGFIPHESKKKSKKEMEDPATEEEIPLSEAMPASFDDFTSSHPDELLLTFMQAFSDKEIDAQIAKFASEEKYELAARLKRLLRQRNENK